MKKFDSFDILEAIKIANWMIKIYEQRRGGYSQKEALKILIEIAEERIKEIK